MKEQNEEEFVDQLSTNLSIETMELVAKLSGGSQLSFDKIKNYMMEIIGIGKKADNPSEYYIAIQILAAQTGRAKILTEKWFEEEK